MPTIEGKDAKVWIDAYVSEAGNLAPVATAIRALIKMAAAGCEEYVSPWKTPAFDLNGPLCVFVIQKEHVTLAFLRFCEGQCFLIRKGFLRARARVCVI